MSERIDLTRFRKWVDACEGSGDLGIEEVHTALSAADEIEALRTTVALLETKVTLMEQRRAQDYHNYTQDRARAVLCERNACMDFFKKVLGGKAFAAVLEGIKEATKEAGPVPESLQP